MRAKRSKGKVETELQQPSSLPGTYLTWAYDPAINPKISGLKPDLLHVRGPTFYVEAKQYANANKAAIAQVLDTPQRLANSFAVSEAVLLILARAGLGDDLALSAERAELTGAQAIRDPIGADTDSHPSRALCPTCQGRWASTV